MEEEIFCDFNILALSWKYSLFGKNIAVFKKKKALFS